MIHSDQSHGKIVDLGEPVAYLSIFMFSTLDLEIGDLKPFVILVSQSLKLCRV